MYIYLFSIQSMNSYSSPNLQFALIVLYKIPWFSYIKSFDAEMPHITAHAKVVCLLSFNAIG